MKMIERFLAACDLSAYTPQVLDYAMTAAKGSNSRIVLANIINRRDIEAIEYAVYRALLVVLGFLHSSLFFATIGSC